MSPPAAHARITLPPLPGGGGRGGGVTRADPNQGVGGGGVTAEGLALPWYLQHMYSASFIASEVASAAAAAAASRFDMAERQLAAVTSFVSFNVAVSRASAGDAAGAMDELAHITIDGHILPVFLRAVCMAQTPGEGHIEAASNDFENALIMSGQLHQEELDLWLQPIRSSVPQLTVEVIRAEIKIKLALMQQRVAKLRSSTGRQTITAFGDIFAPAAAEGQHPKGWANAQQEKHSDMVKLLETTAEKISGLVRNKRRFVLYPNSMCVQSQQNPKPLSIHTQTPHTTTFTPNTPTPCATSTATPKCPAARYSTLK